MDMALISAPEREAGEFPPLRSFLFSADYLTRFLFGPRPQPARWAALDARDQVRRLSVIARKEGDQVRLWTRPGSDYGARFTRIREALAALPAERAVLDGEAVVLRPDATSDFFALR
jgi:hypothetical protein